jgi:hypothetical protein
MMAHLCFKKQNVKNHVQITDHNFEKPMWQVGDMSGFSSPDAVWQLVELPQHIYFFVIFDALILFAQLLKILRLLHC